MSYCESCGAELPEGKLTCPSCGAPVPRGEYTGRDYSNYNESDYSDYYDGGYPSREPAYSYSQNEKTPERVLSTGAFFASVLLMSIPGLGLLLQIIWALGGTGSRNRRNLARAYLIFSVIGIVLAILLAWFITDTLLPLLDAVFGSGQVDFNNFFSTFLD